MDSVSWTSNTKLPSSKSETPSTGCFTSWVIFDDDQENKQPRLHCLERPSHVRLDNLSHYQDTNSNLIGSPPLLWNQTQNSRHLTPDRNPPRTLLTDPRTAPLLSGSTTHYTKNNPFLCEEFNNIQPSPINPFTSYFDSKQKVASQTTQSNGSTHHRESPPCAFSFSSPFVQSHSSHSQEAKQDTVLLFYPEFERGGGETISHVTPTLDRRDLDKLRNLQISDPDDPGSPTLPDDSVEEAEEDGMKEEVESVPYLPDHMTPPRRAGPCCSVYQRRRTSCRHATGDVRLSDDGVLQMFYEKTGRVHTLSVELVQYPEKRRIQPKSPVTHQPICEQLVKLGTTCYHDYRSFRHALLEVLRRLPVVTGGALPGPMGLPVGVGLTEEQVEVRDEFYGTVATGDGRILKQLLLTRVHVLAFLSGSAGCRLGLNDVQVKGKEVVSRHDIIPNTTTRWIRLRDCQLHDQHADKLEFLSSRQIVFTPPPCRRFQLFAFRTAFAEKTLPFSLRTITSVRGAEVTLQSWLLMSQGFSSNRDMLNLIPCENVTVR
ncbi:unnamed protein product [Coregonus sp. 'balchen']|nr:unnamed protein product [Coregonus sp. 'balchen']